MRRARLPVGMAAAGLVLGLGACRPIFIMGWGELAVLVLLALVLLGPLFVRLRRGWKRRKK
jgi:hypothetical protein